jgi:hypothetical protein
MYICVNEKRHSGTLVPYGKKKNKMREQYTGKQQVGGQAPLFL